MKKLLWIILVLALIIIGVYFWQKTTYQAKAPTPFPFSPTPTQIPTNSPTIISGQTSISFSPTSTVQTTSSSPTPNK